MGGGWDGLCLRVWVCVCKAYGNKENTYTHSSQFQVVLCLSSVRERESVCVIFRLFVLMLFGMNANYA